MEHKHVRLNNNLGSLSVRLMEKLWKWGDWRYGLKQTSRWVNYSMAQFSFWGGIITLTVIRLKKKSQQEFSQPTNGYVVNTSIAITCS